MIGVSGEIGNKFVLTIVRICWLIWVKYLQPQTCNQQATKLSSVIHFLIMIPYTQYWYVFTKHMIKAENFIAFYYISNYNNTIIQDNIMK